MVARAILTVKETVGGARQQQQESQSVVGLNPSFPSAPLILFISEQRHGEDVFVFSACKGKDNDNSSCR